VPEDRSEHDGRTIRIAVARLKAASPTPQPDPIVWLTGGPGGSAIALANLALADGLNGERDIIFVEQRGTLHSEPFLACPEIDQFQQELLGLVTTDPGTREKSRAATEACRDRLADDVELSAYDSEENAADVADLRVALGVEEWNLRGVSYGSDLALQILRDHPEGIRSVVLDSVVPPEVNLIESFWPAAAEGYEALFDACAAQPECATGHPDLRDDFFATVRGLDEQPMTVDVPDPNGGPSVRVVVDGYKFANLINMLGLKPGGLAEAPALVGATAAGDGRPVAAALLQMVPGPEMNSYGLQFGVVCREEAGYTDEQETFAAARRALPEMPDRVLRMPPQATQVFDDCAAWDVGVGSPMAEVPTESDVPVLVLNGSLDGVTPPSWAEAATERLPNSELVLVPGAGHDVIRWSDCAVEVMLDFLDTPGAVQSPCLAEMSVPPFAP